MRPTRGEARRRGDLGGGFEGVTVAEGATEDEVASPLEVAVVEAAAVVGLAFIGDRPRVILVGIEGKGGGDPGS